MSDETKDNNPANAVDPEREAKIKAAQEARAARLAAKQAESTSGTTDGEASVVEAPTKEPSPNQPLLDSFLRIIQEHVGEEAVEQSFINERDRHLPYVVIKSEHWLQTATLMRREAQMSFNYLRNLSGVDQETHLEVVYHLLSLNHRHELCVKVQTNREEPSIPSVTPIWDTANWNEREVFDLLGIDFPGHPDLRRIMMSDDWVGYPLRKDYVPLDPEV